MKYFMGLDNGGTTTKAALYDERGSEIGVASRETKMLTPRPGWTERDMEEMWDANCGVMRDVLEKTGVSPDDVAGVAICGHGKGLYLWGKDGKPARNGIISTDNRAYAYPVKWREDGTEARAYTMSCQHIMACQPVALLAWLRDNEPEVMGNIRWVFECKDYVRFRLTGEARGEITDYSGANLVNLYTRQYDDALLECFGLSGIRDALPPLCTSLDIAGYVSEEAAAKCGLNAGTPVAGGMFDIDACATMTDVELEGLLQNTGLIRNRGKIFSVRRNAQIVKAIQAEFGSFDAYLWSFTDGAPFDGKWKTLDEMPTVSDVSRRMSADMKRRGIAYAGPVITYSFLQAVGIVNDHLADCEFREP